MALEAGAQQGRGGPLKPKRPAGSPGGLALQTLYEISFICLNMAPPTCRASTGGTALPTMVQASTRRMPDQSHQSGKLWIIAASSIVRHLTRLRSCVASFGCG